MGILAEGHLSDRTIPALAHAEHRLYARNLGVSQVPKEVWESGGAGLRLITSCLYLILRLSLTYGMGMVTTTSRLVKREKQGPRRKVLCRGEMHHSGPNTP